MTNPVKQTTVTIHGASYQLRTDMSEEAVADLAHFVDEKMRGLDPHGTLPPAKVSVLTSLTIAGELMEEKERAAKVKQDVADRIAHLQDMLDAALEEG
jgi:cell division protein ZapA (FtsZ GTPase activity inhibitor)